MSVHKKFNPIGQAVWPAIRNIYMNVLFYYIDSVEDIVVKSVWFSEFPPMLQARYTQVIFKRETSIRNKEFFKTEIMDISFIL